MDSFVVLLLSGILVVIITQTGIGIYWAGRVSKTLEGNERDIRGIKKWIEEKQADGLIWRVNNLEKDMAYASEWRHWILNSYMAVCNKVDVDPGKQP